MLIFNTTFQVSKNLQNAFIEWLKTEYIPLAIQNEMLFNPLLSKVLTTVEIDGDCYALQFHVHNTDILNKWYESYGKGLNEKLAQKFSSEAVGFSTVLQIIEI